MSSANQELPDSNKLFHDDIFAKENAHISDEWKRIGEIYPSGAQQPLLPETFSREQFGQGNHYECFMLSALATLVRFPDIIRNCFVTKKVRQDGRYTFQFFRGTEWVKVEIDDTIAMEDGDVLYCRSPTEHWWPLLLEKAYAKFYTAYDHLEGCTLQETFYDLTGNPVLNIPMDAKLAKAAGADVTEGSYWLDLAQRVQAGKFIGSVLTKDMDVENMGLQREQQYGILEIFSITGTSSVNDIVLHLHNPFEDEEYIYKGPLNSKDSTWTPKLRAKYDVEDERSIFLPLNTFLKIMNSVQLCYMTPIESDATYFHDEWKGESAGGNPTSVTWRKNPLYYVSNTGTTAAEVVVIIKQEDQRRFTTPDEVTKYLQCGMVLISYVYSSPIPTFYVTGNNHKPIHKSLFLNSREVANAMTIPPNSLCYLVPSCMLKGAESAFTIALYRMKGVDYSDVTINKLSLPKIDWKNPATKEVQLRQKEKDRVDFYVDEATDIHILMHQTKPFVSKSGGDAMTEDYMGMYLYDDTDHKIGGVHAATNYREISIIHRLPRSGRFAVSVTCPRAKGDVPAYVTVVGSPNAHVRIVDPPEDAGLFDDDESEQIDEGEDGEGNRERNPIDYYPVMFDATKFKELPDSNTPFEDKRFMVDNKSVTNGPWIHIGDLYPEGKRVPLLPDVLSRDQFEQGDHFECCCLTAYAALVDSHPDVIRNCFVSKNPRKDGRYTFQFHRYGQWVKVEIDDRIPLVDENTLYCRSPTHHWWPLLLEKAYAKFYTLYQNLEGCTLQEVFHDFTGCPVISIPTDAALSKAAGCDINDPYFWLDLQAELDKTAMAGLTKLDKAEHLGMQEDQSYGILGFLALNNKDNMELSDVLVKIYNPFEEAHYTGPMNKDDAKWTADMRQICTPEKHNLIYMPVDVFISVFLNMQQAYVKGPLEPCWNFNSEWGEGTNGGNPTLITWRENPLYVVRNTSSEPVQMIGMIRQPDQRHLLHRQTNQELNYIQCGMILSKSNSSKDIVTYLVTGNNHVIVHKGLFLNSREVSNVFTVPEDSLCYLVPSAMLREKGKFILSYWYLNQEDAESTTVKRLRTDVARHLPAISHVELRNKEKDRVDFIIDVPTDVHILLTQEKPFKTPNGGDAVAEDSLAMYLYDSNDKRVCGLSKATNFREMGLVEHLEEPGRYALSITCPMGHGLVPCKVEVVALEAAHVRITDAPEFARELGEVDLAFLDPEPEGVPLVDIPLDDDAVFKDLFEDLKALHKDPGANADEIAGLERKMNDRAHELAKAIIGKDRARYLPNRDLETLNPVLNEDQAYMDAERERYGLKKNPRNANKVRDLEGGLRSMADEIAEGVQGNNLDFLDDEYEGIPVADLELMDNPDFADLAQRRAPLLRDPVTNARKLNDLEDDMHDLARTIAKNLHAKERAYLDQEPEGIPLHLLPLNEDEAFSKMEDQLRGLKRKPKKDAKAIKNLEEKLDDRAHELADKLKRDERELFLDPSPLGVPVDDLPLSTDPAFHNAEVQRLELRKEDPMGNIESIKALEDEMNARARELAASEQASLLGFLDQEPYGIPLNKLNLKYNDDFARMEDQLRALKRDPRRNAAEIKALQERMNDLVGQIAAAEAARDRQFLDPDPEGRLVQSLPLDEDPDFVEMDKRRRKLNFSKGDPDKIRDLEDQMNDQAHEIARRLNEAERPDYLKPTFKGLPFGDLPLDNDQEFHNLEVKRQVLKRDPRRNSNAIEDVEGELNDRAMQLAEAKLAGDRGYLDPEPEGVPLRLLSLDDDEAFGEMEAKRAQLKRDPRRNARAIADQEEALNDRAHAIARDLKNAERAKFLEPRPHGIPYQSLPLENDQPFRDLEVQRLLLLEAPQKNATAIQDLEDALNDRAGELALAMKEKERDFLGDNIFGIAREELPLDEDPAFTAKEEQLRELRKNPKKNMAAIAKLEDELELLAQSIAQREVAKGRNFLDPEPEGRLLEELPLDDDNKFHALETEYRQLMKNPKNNNQRMADLEELMNDRARELAKEKNAAERPSYLNKAPKGIPVHELPLDEDEEFGALEAKRAQLMRAPAKNKNAIKDIEDALNLRAEELAQEKIQADREFLDSEPENIPLKYLPLDEDAKFQKLEAERLNLKTQNLRKNDARIKQLENEMNECAHNLAVGLKEKVRDKVLPPRLQGIPVELLALDEDMPFADLEVAHIKARGDGEDPEKEQDLADAMTKRAADVALKLRAEERARLGTPLGFSPDELGLDDNPEFVNKENELFELRHDPQANPEAIADAEADLAALAESIARDMAAQERDFLDPEPEGRRVNELPLDADPTYRGLEEQHRRLKKDPYADPDRLADLEQMMNDRAHELARQKNAEDRTNYLNEAPRNVPLSELPLDTDKTFRELEAKRAKLNQDPRRNAKAIRDVEEDLSARADELANEVLKNDRMFLDDKPENVTLRHLPIDDDAVFQKLEEKRAALKANTSRDPMASRDALQSVEEEMNDRLRTLAREVKENDRKAMEQNPLGIPLKDLEEELDNDQHFHNLEELYRDAKADPSKRKKTEELLQQMNERAEEIAQAVHDKERAALDQNPEGIPLKALPLNDDQTFNALENEARALRREPNGERKNAARLEEIEDALNQRAAQLANESRQAYCDASPEGVPLQLLRLGDDKNFTAMEAELRRLKRNPIANKENISDLEYDLSNRVHEKARAMLQGDRDYLDPEPEDVKLEHLSLDGDEQFHQLEAQRARLKAADPHGNKRAIADLEEKLNERARQLAQDVKAAELRALDQDPSGVPVAVLNPYRDPEFNELADRLRSLRSEPKRNAAGIQEVREAMNNRANALARDMLAKDRDYLDAEPEGVPLSILPLDTDPAFRKLEAERLKLKARDPSRNAKQIEGLEEKLNARAHELAEAQKKADLQGLDPRPNDIPLELVDPHSDPTFASHLSELRRLKENPHEHRRELEELTDALNARCEELAADMLREDRPQYVEANPNGVPTELLPLDTDPVFHEMEVQRAVLKAQNPRRNADKIKSLEARLNERVNQLADEQRNKAMEHLDQEPNGLPLSVVHPQEDPEFARLLNSYLELSKDPHRNAEKLADLEEQMNERALELAKDMLQGNRDYLDADPQGVPASILNLDRDPKFAALEVERAKLRAQDPRRNNRKISELENQLNNRAHELAREQLEEDLRDVNPHPRDIPLELLKPHDDPEFAQLIDEARKLKQDPKASAEELQELVDAMNARAEQLAADALDRQYLDEEPEGVPIADLRLDEDPQFHSMEVERAKLKLKDPKRNAIKIRDLEEQLNDRAHELAKKQLEEDLAGCDPEPEGIPLALLRPTEDPQIIEMIPNLRQLKQNPKQNAEAIKNLEDHINNRAYELADALLEGDRGYLDPAPGGVPLEYLPLDKDVEFSSKEVERAKLKAEDPRRNARRIAELEGALNKRARELAEQKKKAELSLFRPSYEGLDTTALKPYDDPAFSAMVQRLRAMEKEDPSNARARAPLTEDMDARLEELAKEKTEGDLWFLHKDPRGVTLEDIPVTDDADFQSMVRERATLKAQDPSKHAARIAELENGLNSRALELADGVLKNDFEGVDPKPLGIPLELLNPREDALIARILPQLRQAKRNPKEKDTVRDLVGQINNRVQELAQNALTGDRPLYLDKDPLGVPLESLPLDSDGVFHGLEVERAKLSLMDPVKNAKAIEELEDRLNERAHDLAEEVLREDCRPLDQEPEGIPLEVLRPHDNPDFNELAKQARALRSNPRANQAKLQDLEDQMNEMAHTMAREMMEEDRDYLPSASGGIALENLPLHEDPQFRQLEAQRAILKAQDPVKNASQISDLEERLGERAEELAEAQRKEDMQGLNPTPLGVPVALLRPYEDPKFTALVSDLRRFKKNPTTRNKDAIEDLEAKLDERLNELAQNYVDEDRASYLPPTVNGIPLSNLPLNDDENFKALEAERLDLINKNPKANKDAIADLEDALNDRALQIAKDECQRDRQYLPHDLENIPLDALPLDTDRQFADLEARRAGLKAKDPVRNAAAIRELEDQLNDRAEQLARDQLAEDLRAVDPAPFDIPVDLLQPHKDPEFARMVGALRALKADEKADPKKLAALEADMNDRVHELAEAALKDDRPEYLDHDPEGVALDVLPLDSDQLFHQLEAERAALKLEDPKRNAAKIADLEERLNDRAHELAGEQLQKDLEGLPETARGIPIELLRPHEDEEFAAVANQRREMKMKSPDADGDDALVDLMSNRLDALAGEMLEGDRRYLKRDPEGVPLSALPLDTDPEFHDMEVQRAILKAQDPKKNAAKIADLEGKLNNRAEELAKEVLSGDRGYLQPEPEGVPLSVLPLDADRAFHDMEVQRAILKAQDPKKNAAKIADLEAKLSDRADELAQQQLEEDLRDLVQNPRGIPLRSLNPHEDAEFSSYLPELRRLKNDPKRNAPKITELQSKMDNRVDELAKAQVDKDRAFLDAEPEGIPLAQLPLDTDKSFIDTEKKLRAAASGPRANPSKVAELQEELKARARELARAKIQGDRAYLDAEPEGIPIGDVPIDDDRAFREMEAQRAKLKENPSKNAAAIEDLEDQLNARAHELAKEKKKADRDFLHPTSAGVPVELLPLDDDSSFRNMEQQLRRLNRDPRRNAPAIENLHEMMQDRADELGEAMLKGDRDQYLDANPQGINFSDIPVESNPRFNELEKERAILKAEDLKKNADKIADLENEMNDLVQELAKEVRAKNREFLDPEPEGIPIADVPLDGDADFTRGEEYLRALNRNPRRNAGAIEDLQAKLNDRAHELAKGVVADDLACLPTAAYRGIPKEDLNLHSYPKFREAANRRRQAKKKNSPPQLISDIAAEMDTIAREIADDVIDNERAFLDKEPEGMDIHDLPLDDDKEFAAFEAERRRRTKDPRSAKRNKDVVRDLEDKMNDRAHQMAREAFGKMRGFMDQEPEGVPLAKLPLDTDADFRAAEVERYRKKKDPNHDKKKVAELEKRMNDRAHALAKERLNKDLAFLEQMPEGVPLDQLALQSDPAFLELAKQRQALKNGGNRSRAPNALKDIEDQLNDRVHALANDYLDRNRDYLEPEPQNVPIADIPLNQDPLFREMEADLFKARQDPRKNADRIAQLQDDLNARADELAKELLRKERVLQDHEPLGIPLEELPLNYDPILNPLERKRRDLKKNPKKNADALQKLEPEIAKRVNEIAKDFLDKERAFLDQEPEGVPLSRLPLNDDRDFHEMERELRNMKKQPAKNKNAIEDLEERLNDRAHELAREQLARDRDFLDKEPEGVPLAELPLNEDPTFRELEEQRRNLKKDPRANANAVKEAEAKLNDRARELAQEKLDEELAFLDPKPEGILLKDLPLNKDKPFRDMHKQLRELRKDPKRNKAAIEDMENDMKDRAHTLAKRQLADDRNYLNPEPLGVPLGDLDLDGDANFRELELDRHNAKKNPKRAAEVPELENRLNDEVARIAGEFLKKDRAYLDPEPEGIPLEELPLNDDGDFHGMELDRWRLKKDEHKNSRAIGDLEAQLNQRAHELAKEKKGYQDPEFFEANEGIAEEWPRIRELYPEGLLDPVTPETTLLTDVSSAPGDMGFLAPFIAALARHTILISRLFEDKAHPQNQPYRITFFNPDSSPSTVTIDDRVPCDEAREPKFTRVPSRMWYPLLLEKAYAKFIGGYENFNNCNAHDTLRDLTGRPVLHISLEDPKHAAATNMGDYTTPTFWRRVINDVSRGDIFICVTNGEVPSGMHAQCSYALVDVIEAVQGTENADDIIVKLHNCYTDAPEYNGPLHRKDSRWTTELKRACEFNPDDETMIYMPLPTFLKNFSCMQRCHINCGDRLSSPGEWNQYTAGGTSKFTTFRSNPIYLVENKSSRPATILAEVRHSEPLYVDETGCKCYPYTGLTLIQPLSSSMPPTPLITNGTHKFLQKGMMLDSREVCAEMELPPSSTCYLIAYTKDRGTTGHFDVSIYPDMANVTLAPLRHANLTSSPLRMNMKLDSNVEEGSRVDFMVNDACDVHILLHQDKVSDPKQLRRGDAMAEDTVVMSAFNEYGIRVGSSGEPSNAREHAVIFKAPVGGRYSVVVLCTRSANGEPTPASLEIFTPSDIQADFVPVPPDAKPLGLQSQSRFPTISRTATAPSASRGQSRDRSMNKDRNVRRTDSLPVGHQRRGSASRGSADPSTSRHLSRGRR